MRTVVIFALCVVILTTGCGSTQPIGWYTDRPAQVAAPGDTPETVKLKTDYNSLLTERNQVIGQAAALGQGKGQSASVKTSIGTWLKIVGVLAVAAVIPLIYFGFKTIAIGVGLGGVGLIIGGVVINTAERVEQTLADHLGWVIAVLVVLLIVGVVLVWRYRAWFLGLAEAVQASGAKDVARANADTLLPADKARQKEVLVANDVLLPTAPVEVKP